MYITLYPDIILPIHYVVYRIMVKIVFKSVSIEFIKYQIYVMSTLQFTHTYTHIYIYIIIN